MSRPGEVVASGAEASSRPPGHRIALLAGQAFALGLMMAWILIPSTAIFLDSFGSGLLPVTYIGAAVAGVAASAALGAAFRRRPLASVATTVLAGVCCCLIGCWILLSWLDADWVSFGLLVLVPIVVPVGFMFLVGQAGMLLDVRALKALYARVVAGFALGFVTGGSAGPALLAVLGPPEHLLAAAALAAAGFLALVRQTRRLFPMELSAIEHAEGAAPRPTVRLLLRDRYVALIIGFQMLSAVESQWLDFLVFDRAAQRYHDSHDLARFAGQFTAIAYGADLAFLLVPAGLLLRRYGLRYGLPANAGAVLCLVGAVIVASLVQGAGVTIVFVLIVAARVTDLVFSDGAARTSLSAAYQAVPLSTRLVAQATVEGLAVPVAIGVSGLGLLVLRSTVGTDGVVLPVLTGLVVTAWLVVATLVYRGYRANLLAGLRARTLDPAELSIDDPNSLQVIDRLLASGDERDVRLGLDTLTTANHPVLADRLRTLATEGTEGLRTDALRRLSALDGEVTAALALTGLDDPSATIRSVCVEVLGAGGDPSHLSAVMARWADQDPTVRVAATAALSRLGGESIRAEVAAQMSLLAESADAGDRARYAEVLAACEPGVVDRRPLVALLQDSDVGVVNAALAALRWPEDTEQFGLVVACLHDRGTSGAAVVALARGDNAVVDLIDEALGRPLDRRTHLLLARVCRMIGGSPSIEVLHRHSQHRDREVGLAVLTGLGAIAPASAGEVATLPVGTREESGAAAGSSVIRSDLEHAADVLRALASIGGERPADLLRTALHDELDLVRRRVVAALAARYGGQAMGKVALQLAQGEPRLHALAIEWLDVTLTGADRAVTPLLDPGVSDTECLQALQDRFAVPAITRQEILDDLVNDPGERWRSPWISACALYAGYGLRDLDMGAVSDAGAHRSDQPGDGTDIFSETLNALRRRAGTHPGQATGPLR